LKIAQHIVRKPYTTLQFLVWWYSYEKIARNLIISFSETKPAESKKYLIIAIVIPIVIFILILIAVLIVVVVCKRRNKKENQNYVHSAPGPVGVYLTPESNLYEEIERPYMN
jgi:heme/copper-type cytochrome/quinol oxidase subunit 2